MFAKFEDLGVVHVGYQGLAIRCWTCWSCPSVSNPDWAKFYSCGSRTSRSTSWLCSRVLYSAARLQKEVLQLFCGPRCGYKFPQNCSSHLIILKMILRLGFVDLADHAAISVFNTTRGTLGVKRTFWQSSSVVFMHTAFSMQAAGSPVTCVSDPCQPAIPTRTQNTFFNKKNMEKQRLQKNSWEQ